jgi:hypothetical protein
LVLYETIFSPTEQRPLPSSDDADFWHMFFLLKVNQKILSGYIDDKNMEELLTIRQNISLLVGCAVEAMVSDHNQARLGSMEVFCLSFLL